MNDDVHYLEINLDKPFTVEDAHRLIETVPLPLLNHFMHEAHGLVHRVYAGRYIEARWRPWRRRGLRSKQRRYCEEWHRRMSLIADVIKARSEAHDD